MATPPLPDRPTVRIRMSGVNVGLNPWGNRIYLRYSGSAPTGANCSTLASDVSSAWGSHIASLVDAASTLTEVDVLDITTALGASGTWTGSVSGTENSGGTVPEQLAVGVEFGVAIRYRGGKPRVYQPPPTAGKYHDGRTWDSTYIGNVSSGWSAFATALEALSVGSMGTLTHTFVSYYEGYQSRTTGGGQITFKPKYRSPNALTFDVTGYFAKSLMSSQRRRRTASTP